MVNEMAILLEYQWERWMESDWDTATWKGIGLAFAKEKNLAAALVGRWVVRQAMDLLSVPMKWMWHLILNLPTLEPNMPNFHLFPP